MINISCLVIGHYYAGKKPDGEISIAQWDGEDFIISTAPSDNEEWGHRFYAHPQQTGYDVDYGHVFVPYEDYTLKAQEEYANGEG